MNPQQLPIREIREELLRQCRLHRRFVLQAPTGSGKSTQVPQYLHDAGLAAYAQILILQPRRLAARMLAKRVAEERGGDLGGEVGYQVRFDRCIGPLTRIVYLTEGILLRMMQANPRLEGIGAILFDEFHERHLYGDVSLAQALRIQQQGRPDLLLGVMSATLDTANLQRYLAPCVMMQSAGRTYPVQIEYSAQARAVADKPVWEQAAWHVNRLSREMPDGDMLVFMPGAYEIHRTIGEIEKLPVAREAVVMPLHGDLPPTQQDAVMNRHARRKIVVSTNVAETSLTIDGVRVVIDSGLARIPAYDPHRGINTLLVQKISQASAEQRAGRAGRTAPGYCLRLWGEREHLQRLAREIPEIRRLDLAEMLLHLLDCGVHDLDAFPWFERPEEKSLARSLGLLKELEMIESMQAPVLLTGLGRQVAAFPLHPRYSRMLLAASDYGCLPDCALLAALSQNRSIFLPISDPRQAEAREERFLPEKKAAWSDFQRPMEAFRQASAHRFSLDFCREWGLHHNTIRQVAMLRDQLLDLARREGLYVSDQASSWSQLAKVLLHGFSDHLAKRLDRSTFRCALPHGRKGELRKDTLVRESTLSVAVEIEERDVRGEVTVLLQDVTAVEEEWLLELFPRDMSTTEVTRYDSEQKRVQSYTVRRFRDLVLDEKESGKPSLEEAARILAAETMAGRLPLRQWNEGVDRFLQRWEFCAFHCPDFGFHAFSEEEKTTFLEQLFYGCASYKEIRDKEVLPALKESLGWAVVSQMDQLAPESIALAGGARVRLRYEAPGKAILAATIQKLFDEPGDRRLAGGRSPLTYELLAPNQRPVQITQDLKNFWTNSYPEVRKQLKGRYPKHEWR